MPRTVIVTAASPDQASRLATFIAQIRAAGIVEPVRVLQSEPFPIDRVASTSDVTAIVFQAAAGRAFPRVGSAALVSDFDVSVFFDVHTEIIDRRGFDLLVRGAMTKGTALVPLIHGAYQTFVNPLPYRDALARVWSDVHHPKSFTQFGSQPLPSKAAIAFQRGSQVPQACLTILKRFKPEARVATAVMEQIALSAVAKVSKLPMARLPAWCAWESSLYSLPDYVYGSPVTPYWPAQSISMIHQAEAECVLR